MNKVDLIKRIKLLDSQLKQKKTLVEKEMTLIENICKEIVSLKAKLDVTENKPA